jgi:carboxymethylenebutenolidase
MEYHTPAQKNALAVYRKHARAKLDGDLHTIMATMTDHPHVYNLPTRMGGEGRKRVSEFYSNHLVGKFWPPDVQMKTIAVTVEDHQLVEELRVSFTHTVEVEWMLPGLAPTGKRVVVDLAVIVGLDKGKVSHEHTYWDQASILAQLGFIDPNGLPIVEVGSPRLPRRGIRHRYECWPPDLRMEPISVHSDMTVDGHQSVEELRVSFTHTIEVEWMLPGLAPTGKRVVLAFADAHHTLENGKVFEHTYWDQASVFVQLGLIDPTGLPVVGAESAGRLKSLKRVA